MQISLELNGMCLHIVYVSLIVTVIDTTRSTIKYINAISTWIFIAWMHILNLKYLLNYSAFNGRRLKLLRVEWKECIREISYKSLVKIRKESLKYYRFCRQIKGEVPRQL